MDEHTPGEWTVERGFIGADVRVFVVIPGQDGMLVNKESDAYLLAAAPDLLTTLKRLVKRIEQGERITPDLFVMQSARNAIAKAVPS